MRKTLEATVPADLIDKVYKAEGWTKIEGEGRVKRVKNLYDLSIDYRKNRYVATPHKAEGV